MSFNPQSNTDALTRQGRNIVRRFTDQLEGVTDLERQVQDVQLEKEQEERNKERQRLRLLWEDPSEDRAS